MVSSISVLNDWRNPNCIETHALNVVKVVNDSFVTSSTVVTEVLAIVILTIISSKSISQELIDGSFSPFIRRASQDAVD
jgi:hypothetical protein